MFWEVLTILKRVILYEVLTKFNKFFLLIDFREVEKWIVTCV
jgi:hypothetical protein